MPRSRPAHAITPQHTHHRIGNLLRRNRHAVDRSGATAIEHIVVARSPLTEIATVQGKNIGSIEIGDAQGGIGGAEDRDARAPEGPGRVQVDCIGRDDGGGGRNDLTDPSAQRSPNA